MGKTEQTVKYRRRSPLWHSISVFARVMLRNRQAFFGTVEEYAGTPLGQSFLEGQRNASDAG